LKSFWNLSLFDSLRLSQLQRENKRLYRAYLLKDALVRTLDGTSEPLARVKLDQWIRWARRLRLEPFKCVALTVAKHAEGILGLRSVGPVEWQDRGPQREGPHHHAAGLRLSQCRRAHRAPHALLLGHETRPCLSLAWIHSLTKSGAVVGAVDLWGRAQPASLWATSWTAVVCRPSGCP
jgi:hypothetical protein